MQQMKIRGVGRLRANIRRKGRFSRTVRRFVKTKGMLSGVELAREMDINPKTIDYIMSEITRIVRAGYEVRFGSDESGIRFYPMLTKECDKLIMISQTIGEFREATLANVPFDIFREGEQIDESETEKFKKSVEKEFVSTSDFVTPDMMVTCPKCGHDFRVGRKAGA